MIISYIIIYYLLFIDIIIGVTYDLASTHKEQQQVGWESPFQQHHHLNLAKHVLVLPPFASAAQPGVIYRIILVLTHA